MRSNYLKPTCIRIFALLLTFQFYAICAPHSHRSDSPSVKPESKEYSSYPVLVSQLPETLSQTEQLEEIQEPEQLEKAEDLSANQWPSITRPGNEKDYILGGGDILKNLRLR